MGLQKKAQLEIKNKKKYKKKRQKKSKTAARFFATLPIKKGMYLSWIEYVATNYSVGGSNPSLPEYWCVLLIIFIYACKTSNKSLHNVNFMVY